MHARCAFMPHNVPVHGDFVPAPRDSWRATTARRSFVPWLGSCALPEASLRRSPSWLRRRFPRCRLPTAGNTRTRRNTRGPVRSLPRQCSTGFPLCRNRTAIRPTTTRSTWHRARRHPSGAISAPSMSRSRRPPNCSSRLRSRQRPARSVSLVGRLTAVRPAPPLRARLRLPEPTAPRSRAPFALPTLD